MNQTDRHDALRALGYTPREATFLTLAALHSGYFLRRQYLQFSRTSRGGVATRFITKFLAKPHGLATVVGRHTDLFHVCGEAVYAALGEPDNRRRRCRSPLVVKARLMGLDYVLAHLEDEFLATEGERVAYFTERWQVDRQALPSKRFRGAMPDTTRFFVDKYPIAVARIDGAASEGPAFCYVDPGDASLAGFETYLASYEPLFQALPCARVVFVGDRRGSLPAAHRAFERFWRHAGQRQASRTDRLLGYFAVRAVYERRKPGLITKETLDRVRDGRAAFSDPRVEALFERWCHEGDASIRAVCDVERQPMTTQTVTCSTWYAEHHYDLFGTVWRTAERRKPVTGGARSVIGTHLTTPARPRTVGDV